LIPLAIHGGVSGALAGAILGAYVAIDRVKTDHWMAKLDGKLDESSVTAAPESVDKNGPMTVMAQIRPVIPERRKKWTS
jgi:hypothetical protein